MFTTPRPIYYHIIGHLLGFVFGEGFNLRMVHFMEKFRQFASFVYTSIVASPLIWENLPLRSWTLH